MKMKKWQLALAAAAFSIAAGMGTLQAADEASSLDGDTVTYDMGTGVITAEGDVLMKRGSTSVAGKSASYNTKTQQGEVTGNVIAVRDTMRLTAAKIVLDSLDSIRALGGVSLTKEDLSLQAASLSLIGQDQYIAEGDVHGKKGDKTFIGPRAEYYQAQEYMLIPQGGTITTADGTFTANHMEGWLKEERYKGVGSAHIVSPPKSFEGGGDVVDYIAKDESGKGKCILDGNAWAYQGNNALKSNHLTVYLANTGDVAVE